jgi:hypothetical protein
MQVFVSPQPSFDSNISEMARFGGLFHCAPAARGGVLPVDGVTDSGSDRLQLADLFLRAVKTKWFHGCLPMSRFPALERQLDAFVERCPNVM